MEWLGEFGDQLWRLWAYLTTGRVLATIFGVGFAILAIFLFFASRTKWGQTKPLTKCLFVSVLLHVWLLLYALGTPKILPQGDPDSKHQNISVSFEADPFATPAEQDAAPPPPLGMDALEDENELAEEPDNEPQPWESNVPLADLPVPEELQELPLQQAKSGNIEDNLLELSDALAPDLLPSLEPTPLPALPPPEALADTSAPEAVAEEAQSHDSSEQITTPDPQPMDMASDPSSIEPVSDTIASQVPSIVRPVATNHSPVRPPVRQSISSSTTLPTEYQLRQAPNRLQLTAAYGADADSEAAVKAGLQWLVKAQSPDGSWNAKQYGAGEERMVLGMSRGGTGDKADTGVSGLALLAFLSAGHTHRQGEHRETVRRGLEYLLAVQMPSGDLSGPKQVGRSRNVLNARMYCHSIASLALAEAYTMTLDNGLRDALLRAAQYSLNAQDVRGGGWRYEPGDPGDLSQFGWQAMMLKSVERSGIKIPIEVSRRMRRFLDSCSAGTYGGLATYKPKEGRPSDTMTAEALACRLMLNYPQTLEARKEALDMIMSNRPGTGENNTYFWYYATLALFQLQDENWRVWNQAMKTQLIRSQVPSYGVEPGSWNPDGLWAGYGGRVYSTAMGCLCLEVYYRFLPMYQTSNIAQNNGGVLGR